MRARDFNATSFAFGIVFTATALTLVAMRLGWGGLALGRVWPVVVLIVGVAVLANALLRRSLRAAHSSTAVAGIDGDEVVEDH